MSDAVRCRIPFGMIGRAVHASQVRRDVDQVFEYRFGGIGELFAGAGLAELK